MTVRSILWFLAAGSITACGSAQSGGSHVFSRFDPVTNQDVTVRPGPMPPGESFTGSYHSREIGDVELDQTGDQVVGTYEYDRASCHARGRIEGRVTGNLLTFAWTEDQRECGRLTIPPGRGYLLFWADTAHNARASGEWGIGEAETGGGPWSLFRAPVRARSRNVAPASGGDPVAPAAPSAPTPSADPLQGL